MSRQQAVVARHEGTGGSVRSYTIGFILSLILTFAAYICVVQEVFKSWTLVGVLAALAVTQLFVQLYFFLHLGRESKPRWNLTVAAFAAMVVFILVFGSLWIMKNIQYNHQHGGHDMTPAETDDFIKQDEGYEQ